MFPADEGELPDIPSFRDSRVFHVPFAIRSYYVLTPKHVWRVIRNHNSLFAQRYDRTLGRKAFLDCLLEGRESGPPLQEWETVARRITEAYP